MSQGQQQTSTAFDTQHAKGNGNQRQLVPSATRQTQPQRWPQGFQSASKADRNVSDGERAISVAAGSVLALLGLGRRDLTGLLITGVGGALAYRGVTGHCQLYQTMGMDTAQDAQKFRSTGESDRGVQVSASFLINKSPETLYSFWRNFENLPQFMTHLESVRNIDDRRSHWVAKAPSIYGGKVEWDAEITAEEQNSRLEWRSLPGSDVEHRGSIRFVKALGDRGTKVTAELNYHPPAGQIGRWIAKLFGEEPKQQIHDDLRRFKRLMELGEILTIDGQPHGACLGRGTRSTE